MDKKSLFSIKDTAFTLTSVLPFVFSMAICEGMGSFAGALFSCIATLICASPVDNKKQVPVYVSLILITFTLNEYGASTLAFSILICGVLLIISGLFFNKIKETFRSNCNNSALGSIMLSCALVVTILFTNDYFSIGATGNVPNEMIQSYLSLGFHPNWRGILYGTIVMVVMITFPRKFKKATKIISAPFIALIITTVLNLFLNPSDLITAIREVGPLSFADYKNSLLLPVLNEKPNILISIISGITLFISSLNIDNQDENKSKKEIITSGVLNCVAGFVTCMYIPNLNKNNNLIGRIIAAIISGVLFFTLHDFIARIPVSACAVVIIVGVWQSIKWSEVKKIFLSLPNILIFVIIIAFALIENYNIALLMAMALNCKRNNTCG